MVSRTTKRVTRACKAHPMKLKTPLGVALTRWF